MPTPPIYGDIIQGEVATSFYHIQSRLVEYNSFGESVSQSGVLALIEKSITSGCQHVKAYISVTSSLSIVKTLAILTRRGWNVPTFQSCSQFLLPDAGLSS